MVVCPLKNEQPLQAARKHFQRSQVFTSMALRRGTFDAAICRSSGGNSSAWKTGRPVDCYKAIHDTIEDTEMPTPMVQSCSSYSCCSYLLIFQLRLCQLTFLTPIDRHDYLPLNDPFFSPVLSLSFLIISHFLSLSYPISAWCVLLSKISLQGGHCQSDCGFYIDVSWRQVATFWIAYRSLWRLHTGWERHDLDIFRSFPKTSSRSTLR